MVQSQKILGSLKSTSTTEEKNWTNLQIKSRMYILYKIIWSWKDAKASKKENWSEMTITCTSTQEVASQKIMMELISSAGDICMIYRIYDYLEQIDQDDLESRQDSAFHYSYFKSFGTCQFVSSTHCRGPLRLCLVSGGKLLGGMSLRARLTWKGHRQKGRWKAMDRVWGCAPHHRRLRTSVRAALQCWLALAGEARRNHPVSGQRGICQPDSWICIQSGPNDWSGTPQDTRVSVRRNQGSGHVRQVLMWFCNWQYKYIYIHCDLTCLTRPSPAQKTHLQPRVKWSVHFHFLNVCSVLLVIYCLRFASFHVAYCSCIMIYSQTVSSRCNVQCISYCTQVHYFPFTLSVFAVYYILSLYLWLYLLRIFCS